MTGLLACLLLTQSDVQSGFLAFQLATDPEPVVVGGVELKRTISRKDAVAYAWVDVGRLEVKTPEYKVEPGKVMFYLESPGGRTVGCSASVDGRIKSTNVACVVFLPGSGADFVSPKLVAELDGGRIGEWVLEDYPTDVPVIPDDEPSLTEVSDVLGLTIKVSADVLLRESKVGRHSGFVNLWIDVDGQFDPRYEHWVHYNVTESTYRKEPHWGKSGRLFDQPAKTGVGQSTEFAAFADRVRVVGEVEVRQIHVEPATFKGLQVVRDRNRELWVVNRREQKVVLSTGVEVVMPSFEHRVEPSQNEGLKTVSFRVDLPGGTSGLSLPSASGIFTNTEGIRLECRQVLALGRRENPGGGRWTTGWNLAVLADPSSLTLGRPFDVTIEVRHVAPVGKQEFRMLVPLEKKL